MGASEYLNQPQSFETLAILHLGIDLPWWPGNHQEWTPSPLSTTASTPHLSHNRIGSDKDQVGGLMRHIAFVLLIKSPSSKHRELGPCVVNDM